jgi:hypothetical protein
MGSKKRRVKFAAGIVTVKDTQAHPHRLANALA